MTVSTNEIEIRRKAWRWDDRRQACVKATHIEQACERNLRYVVRWAADQGSYVLAAYCRYSGEYMGIACRN